MLLPTYEDLDEDLVNEWCQYMGECSIRLIRTLTKHAKRKVELQAAKNEMIMKELERFKDVDNVKDQLIKMEKSLQKYDKENMKQKAKKFTRDRIIEKKYEIDKNGV
ncbi:hypothetical protein NDU88_006172 [Pleurodeles waltl]|uniref:Uncharacterized protein n=1 Tax=Pleurodeles waltl TaxID=8319 RepID=A0AAV7PKQ0_PLEWA|nr:hypothetical protein NDU88_006172 [Pleurodeles waltl]